MTILNAVLVRYAKGYKSATDATSISSYGRKESFLSLSSLEDTDSAQQSGEKTLDLYAELQRTVTIAIEPLTDADCPYKGVFVRDAVTAPNLSASPTTYRVVSITAGIDDEGFATFVPELDTKADAFADRTKLWLKRVGDGTLAGRSPKAQLIRPLDTQVLSGKVEVVTPSNFSQATVAVEASARWSPDKTVRITQVDATLDTPGTSTTTVVIKKNGSTVVTLSLTSGIYHNTALPVDLSLTQFDWLTVETTAAGTGAANLNVQMVGGPGY
jgi:hypothetical protein